MFCINCGAQLPDGAKFCANCGARVAVPAPAPAPAPAPEEKSVPVVPETAARTPEPTEVVEAAVKAVEAAAKAVETVTEPVKAAEPAPEPVAEPVSEPVAEPTSETVAEPVTEPTPEPTTEPAAEPVTEPVSEPVAEPVSEPVYQPESEPVYQPDPEPVYQPAPEPVYQPAPERAEERVPAAVGASAYTAPVDTAPAYVPPEPVHTEKSQGKKAKAPKAPARGSAGRIILSVLLSILLCVSILASTLVTVVKFKVNRTELNQFVQELIDEKGAKGVLDMILGAGGAKAARPARTPVRAATLGVAVTGATHVASTVSGLDLDLGDFDLSDLENVDELLDQISETLYDNVKDKVGWENVEQRDIRKALDDPLVDEFLDQATKDLVDGVLNEGATAGKGLTPESITDFVVEHKDEIEDLVKDAGYTGELKINTDKLEDSIRSSIGDGISVESLPEEVSGQINKVQEIYDLVVSLPVLIGLWAFTALLIVLLIVVNRHRISAVLSCVGIPALIVGILFLAAWGVMSFLPQMKEEPFSLISTFIGKQVLIVGAGLGGGGLVFIIVNVIIRAVQKKKRSA